MQSDRSQELDYASSGASIFGLGFIEFCDDQLGFGHRAPHEVMDAHVAWYFIPLLGVFRSKLTHFCPIVTKHNGALIGEQVLKTAALSAG